MMLKANPDVTLYIPQAQFPAVQTRLTDYLLQSQSAFVQSFSGDLSTTFDILFEKSPASTLESLQLVLCPATHGTSIVVTQDRTLGAAPQSTHLATLMARLVAVCTAHEGTWIE